MADGTEVKRWVIFVAALLVGFEAVRPLRGRRREAKSVRTARNLAVAGLAAATVSLLEQPVVMPIARRVARNRWGLTAALPPRSVLRTTLAIVALDYTLYLWHVLVHRVPAFWRFHAVHHVDLELDTSTALRFHVGELMLSIPWRAAQVWIIGVDPRTLKLWQSLTLASVLFHHSNARLPRRFERLIGLVFVTPRMHGLHHSVDPAEMNSNWSSGLSLWDRLHGTFRPAVQRDEVRVGVAGFERPANVTLPLILQQPFRSDPLSPPPACSSRLAD